MISQRNATNHRDQVPIIEHRIVDIKLLLSNWFTLSNAWVTLSCYGRDNQPLREFNESLFTQRPKRTGLDNRIVKGCVRRPSWPHQKHRMDGCRFTVIKHSTSRLCNLLSGQINTANPVLAATNAWVCITRSAPNTFELLRLVGLESFHWDADTKKGADVDDDANWKAGQQWTATYRSMNYFDDGKEVT